MYTTKCTNLGKNQGYGCRVFKDGVLVVEAKAATRLLVGPVFRDLLRTLDTLGGDAFTKAARKRKFKEGNLCATPRHHWSR